ncbi:MAG TPA: Rrf2 family transcriptional regulator [Spirochaetia bacterium]|nr:Rrf2 family transcriptional regulator [Spirochaetia bacterium]
MLTLSAKAVYGLTAVLALARNHSNGPMQIRDIADANNIPQHYLEQLLVTLKKSGIVESFRGSQGGYALADSPLHITVLQVLSSLDGKLEIVPEQKRDGALLFFWNSIERGVKELLTKSLEELVTEKQASEKQFVYHI